MLIFFVLFHLGVCQNSQNVFSLLDNFSWTFQNLNLPFVQTLRVKFFADIKFWDWHTKTVFLLISAVSLVLNFMVVPSKAIFKPITLLIFIQNSNMKVGSWLVSFSKEKVNPQNFVPKYYVALLNKILQNAPKTPKNVPSIGWPNIFFCLLTIRVLPRSCVQNIIRKYWEFSRHGENELKYLLRFPQQVHDMERNSVVTLIRTPGTSIQNFMRTYWTVLKK